MGDVEDACRCICEYQAARNDCVDGSQAQPDDGEDQELFHGIPSVVAYSTRLILRGQSTYTNSLVLSSSKA